MRTLPFIALATAFASTPASAEKPEVLVCMESGYSNEEQAVIDNYVETFDINSMEPDQALVIALGERAADCAGDKYPDEGSLIAILQHRFAALSLAGIETTRPDIAEVIGRMDKDLDPAKRQRLFGLFELMVFGDPETGVSRELTAEEDKFFNDTVLDPPVSGTVEQAELIGGYMAARVMMRDAEEQLSGR